MQYQNSPLDTMQYLQMLESQQAPQTPRNAIAEGAKTGIEAAKRSLEMNEREERRALGMAMLNFNTPAPQYGDDLSFGGNLGRISQAFLPAVQAYNTERDRVMNLNNQLMQQQQKEAQHAQEMAYKQQQHDLNERELRERALYHAEGLQNERAIAGMKHKETETLTPEGEINLDAVPVSERNKYVADIFERSQAGHKAINVMKTADQMLSIMRNNPGLAGSYKTLLLAENPDDPSLWERFKQEGLTHEELTALQLFKKAQSRLIVEQIQGVSGRVATDAFKKYVSLMKPGMTLQPEVIESLWHDIHSEMEPIYADAKEVEKLSKQRKYKHRGLPEYTAPSFNAPTGGPILKSQLGTIGDAELNAAIAAAQGGQ